MKKMFIIDGKEFKFHCNNCYQECDKNNEEGCFTNDVEQSISDKEFSCLDGTWNGVTPNFKGVQ